jgi:hypothetical protein
MQPNEGNEKHMKDSVVETARKKWHVRYIDVGRLIILRWILDKQDVTMCTVFKCPRISYEGLL